MITKEMKVELWLLALCVVIAILIGCSEESKPIDPERQRIEHINKIDSTTLRTRNQLQPRGLYPIWIIFFG